MFLPAVGAHSVPIAELIEKDAGTNRALIDAAQARSSRPASEFIFHAVRLVSSRLASLAVSVSARLSVAVRSSLFAVRMEEVAYLALLVDATRAVRAALEASTAAESDPIPVKSVTRVHPQSK